MRHLLLLGLLACGTPPAELEDAQTCETLAADSAPLRMLTRTQVDLSLETLMNVEGTARTRLPRDSTMHGFEGFAESGAMSPLIADGWMRLAEDATEQVDWTALVPCDPASIDRTCAEAFVRDFGRRAWRRPLDDDEALLFDGLYDVLSTEQSVEDALSAVVQAMETGGLKPENAEITMRASTEVDLDVETGQKVLKFLDTLEDLDDTQDVFSNANIPEEAYGA